MSEKMDGCFIAFVLLKEPVFDSGKFIEDMSSVWGVEVDSTDAKKDVFVWDFGGMIASCALMSAPVPNNEAEQNAATNYMWEDAVAVTKSHTAHLLVAVLPKDQPAIEAGKLLVKVCDACLMQEHAIGVYTSGTVFEPSFYREVASVMHDDELPLLNWIYLGLYSAEKGNCGYTYGLNAFGKNEIEVLDSKKSLEDLQDFLLNIASYCIESDVILQDGETIGFSAKQKLKITLSQGVNLDGKTLKIAF
ncbi:DUF4261 domain-containing protein [Breznakiellaceae bacterium SP9]